MAVRGGVTSPTALPPSPPPQFRPPIRTRHARGLVSVGELARLLAGRRGPRSPRALIRFPRRRPCALAGLGAPRLVPRCTRQPPGPRCSSSPPRPALSRPHTRLCSSGSVPAPRPPALPARPASPSPRRRATPVPPCVRSQLGSPASTCLARLAAAALCLLPAGWLPAAPHRLPTPAPRPATPLPSACVRPCGRLLRPRVAPWPPAPHPGHRAGLPASPPPGLTAPPSRAACPAAGDGRPCRLRPSGSRGRLAQPAAAPPRARLGLQQHRDAGPVALCLLRPRHDTERASPPTCSSAWAACPRWPGRLRRIPWVGRPPPATPPRPSCCCPAPSASRATRPAGSRAHRFPWNPAPCRLGLAASSRRPGVWPAPPANPATRRLAGSASHLGHLSVPRHCWSSDGLVRAGRCRVRLRPSSQPRGRVSRDQLRLRPRRPRPVSGLLQPAAAPGSLSPRAPRTPVRLWVAGSPPRLRQHPARVVRPTLLAAAAFCERKKKEEKKYVCVSGCPESGEERAGCPRPACYKKKKKIVCIRLPRVG
ncbi:basic proline-rich protein-like [Triticum aestivum]|uniref:basic proline-rich protein-like n=1 Tax=Triticum aestivum TaxID=4565 RepID=UPI001D02688B|nr:basic proline-rich protein-like [Triticum aestivum]